MSKPNSESKFCCRDFTESNESKRWNPCGKMIRNTLGHRRQCRKGVVSRSISRNLEIHLFQDPFLGGGTIYSCPVSACVRRPLSGCGCSIRWISCTAFGALSTAGARCSRAAAQSLRETGAVLLGVPKERCWNHTKPVD